MIAWADRLGGQRSDPTRTVQERPAIAAVTW
jgi:hypothetical protein